MLDLFQAAVARVEGRAATVAALTDRVPSETALLAVGKAADAMARGAAACLGDDLVTGLVVTKYAHGDARFWRDTPVAYRESAHPVPDDASLAAGRVVADFVTGLPPGLPLLCLISGGASALVELPRPGIELDLLRRANDWLLGSGLDIHAINRVRQGMSQLKGGGLLDLAGSRPVTGCYISDVAGDDPAVIGSGLLGPIPEAPLPRGLPDWLVQMLQPVVCDAKPRQATRRIVASLDLAMDAAAAAATARGMTVHRQRKPLAGDAAAAAQAIVATLDRGAPGVYIWGGETTVALPPEPGRGGRNQHLALVAATALAGRSDIWLLSAGTDGSDGPTGDAGALVDGGTIARAAVQGFEPLACIAAADAGSLLAASDDLINTGPTATNVTDLVIALKGRPAPS